MAIDDDRIEKLKRKLYSRTQEPVLDLRTDISPGMESAPSAWGNDGLKIPEDMATTSTHPFLKKFLWIAGIFFIFSVGIAAYMFFGGGDLISSNNVDISVVGPSQIASGQEVDLNLSLANQNRTDLTLSELTVDYPDGSFADADSNTQLTHTEESIGTIAKGQTAERPIKVFLFGNKDVTKTIKFTLKYQVSGSNAVFTKEKDYDLTISSSPLIVNTTAPAEITAGQDITFKTTVTSNSTALLHNVLVVANYPAGFTFENATPVPQSGKNYIWSVGDLKSGDTKTISVTGKLVAQDGEQRTFKFMAGVLSADKNKDIDATLGESDQTITVSKPFLSTTLSLNGDDSDEQVPVAALGQVSGIVSFTNTLPDPVSNVSVKIKLSGSAVSGQDITANNGGFYQSSDNTISWDHNSTQDLASLNPGDTVSLSFSFGTAKPGSTAKNPEADVAVTVSGSRTSAQSGVTTVTSSASKSALLISNLALSSKTLQGGPLSNSGSVPPKANHPTNYTVDWALTNTWNTVSGAKVTTTLPSYVDWTGSVSPTTENIVYDSGSRTVTWTPDSVSAGAGYSYAPREVFFQVTVHPSTSQVGTAPALTSQIQVKGTDTFSHAAISFSSAALTTQTSDSKDTGIVSQ